MPHGHIHIVLKSLLITVALLFHLSGTCADFPRWLGNFSLSMSHGLNDHLDGNHTIYWDEYTSRYQVNRSTSKEISYRFKNGFGISLFREKFSGIYKDSISLYRHDLIYERWGKNMGISFSYKIDISKHLSIIPSLGVMRRKGYEFYVFAFPFMAEAQTETVELSDLGLTTGLTLNYSMGKGFSLFALADYTRFVYLRSTESGERDFYDGPTHQYVRTRVGLQYSFSHLLREKGQEETPH